MMPATPQQAEKKAKAAAQQAVLNGASPQEARAIELQTYARESGGTIEAVAASGGKTGRGSFAYDSDDGFWLSNGSERALIGYGASMSDVSSFLGNSGARDLGMKFAYDRLVAKQETDAAFARGMVRGEQAYQRGYQERMANSGRIDFDLSKALAADNAMWGRGRQNAANFNRVMNNPYVVGTIGALQTLEGAVLTATGAAMSATGWGALAGVPIAAFGADQMQAGLRTVYNRQYTDSFANQGLQAAGLSPMQAGIAEAVFGGAASIGSVAGNFGRVTARTTHVQTRTAYDVNNIAEVWGNLPPWKNGTDVITEIVPPGTRYNMVVSRGQAEALMRGDPAFGGFATPDHIPDQSFARENLVILEQFKRDVSRAVTVETIGFQRLNRGITGALGDFGGNANQVEFLNGRNLKLVSTPRVLP